MRTNIRLHKYEKILRNEEKNKNRKSRIDRHQFCEILSNTSTSK